MAGGVYGGPIQVLLFYGVMAAYLPLCYAVRYAHKRITALEKRLKQTVGEKPIAKEQSHGDQDTGG